MRRIEERLAVRSAGSRDRIAWIRRLQARQFKIGIREQGMQVASRVLSSDDVFVPQPGIVDGLGNLCSVQHATERDSASNLRISEVRLPGEAPAEAGVRNVSIWEGRQTAVRHGQLIPTPCVRWGSINLGPARVHAPESVRCRPPEIREEHQMLLPVPSIRASDQVSRLPHRRKSVDVRKLQDSERRGFLHEAAVLRHVPAERAELLAVFRHVPIEMISRLRFVSERNEIVYGIAGAPNRTQTRVHDIAAVRDSSTQEVHIVPHRTRSRPVALS